MFVAGGCVVAVVGELAVASCGSVLCVSGLSVFVLVELLFVACGCVVVVVVVVGELAVGGSSLFFVGGPSVFALAGHLFLARSIVLCVGGPLVSVLVLLLLRDRPFELGCLRS